MAILRLTLSNQRAEIARVRATLAEFLDDEGIPPAMLHRVRLVVEELVVNVIQHAFADDAKHAILLDVRTEPGGIAIVVEDDGRPFDPCAVSLPKINELLEAGKSGGLGVAIIKKMAGELEYKRVGEKNRVRVFVAHRTPAGSH
jgi:serine/threonine-protein kinase RsbW